jgi:hypothetical protein
LVKVPMDPDWLPDHTGCGFHFHVASALGSVAFGEVCRAGAGRSFGTSGVNTSCFL